MRPPTPEQWEEWMKKSLIDGTVHSGNRAELLIDLKIWNTFSDQTKKEIWKTLELMNKIGVKNGYEKALEESKEEELIKALEEIAKGEGAYSQDQLEHAGNTIRNMKEIARDAVAKATGNENYCYSHHRPFERIEDREEHFEHEHADAFGCPTCYNIQKMEG